MSDNSNDSNELGNTNSSSKQCGACKKWFFTYNNYTEDEIVTIVTIFDSLCDKYVFQEELGKEGTPHLQGVVFCKKKTRWTEFKLSKKIHWESVKGKDEQAIDYCSKEDTRNGKVFSKGIRLKKPLKLLDPANFYEWQKDVMKIVDGEPCDRTIYWYHESVGNVGKSTFIKYLCAKKEALLVSGKGSDMKYLIVKYKETYGDYPELILFDIPRTCENYVSYTGMEEVKNGCFASTKYECEMVIMNSPHIICFSNFEPNYSAMSEDRWNVIEIKM